MVRVGRKPNMGCLLSALCACLGIGASERAWSQSALKQDEIETAFMGNTFRVTTRQIPIGDPSRPTGMTTRSDGGYIVYDIFFRSDRSIIFRCTAHLRNGSTVPCRGGGHARDVGVWSVENENLCYQFLTARGGSRQCYKVLPEGAGFRLRLTQGPPSTIDGEYLARK